MILSRSNADGMIERKFPALSVFQQRARLLYVVLRVALGPHIVVGNAGDSIKHS